MPAAHRTLYTAALVLLCAHAALPPAWSQRIYDSKLDEAARQAQSLAEKLETKALFDRQLDNLTTLAKEDFATAFSGAERVMRNAISTFHTWCDVNFHVNAVGFAIGAPGSTDVGDEQALSCPAYFNQSPAVVRKEASEHRREIEKRLEEIAARKKALQESIDALKRKMGDDGETSVSMLFERIGDVGFLLEFAASGQVPGIASASETLGSAGEVLTRLTEAYERYDNALEGIEKVRDRLGDLAVTLKKIQLEQLQVEEEHFKRLAQIHSRRLAEERDIQAMFDDYRALILRFKLSDAKSAVGDTLQNFAEVAAKSGGREDRERLVDLLRALHSAAALTARGRTPALLEQLRLAHEEHRYSIRKSAAEARGYEAIASTGARRLALFHRGGLRPQTVAELIYNALTLANLGVLTAKQ